MKFILPLLFVIASCSQPNSAKNPSATIEQMIMELAPSTINLEEIEGSLSGQLVESGTAISLGDIYEGAKVSKRITLSAKTEILNLDISGFRNASTFLFKYSNCPSSLKRLRSCIIDIEFTPAAPAQLTENITLSSGLSFDLTANVIPKLVPTAAESNAQVEITSSLNLGDFNGLPKTGRLTVINKGNEKTIVIDADDVVAKGFAIVSYCPPSLKRSRSCQIDISYASTEELVSDLSKSAILKVNQVKEAVISITHKAPVQVESGDFSWTTNPLNLGTVSTVTKKIIYVRNSTGKELTSLLFSSLPSGVSISRTNCLDSLRSSRTCFIELEINPTQMYNEPFSIEYSYFNSRSVANLNISANIVGGMPVSVACSVADAQDNRWNTDNYSQISGVKIKTDVSSCNVSQCLGYNQPSIQEKSCMPISCSVDNSAAHGVNLNNVIAVSGLLPNCAVAACDQNTHEVSSDQKSCIPAVCSLTNATFGGITSLSNVISVSGTVPSCLVTACSTDTHQPASDQKSCIPAVCTMDNAALGGVDLTNVVSVSGSVPNCMIASCTQDTHEPAVDNKSCIPAACSLANAQLGGVILTNVVSVSGTVPSCLVDSCTPYTHEPAQDEKSCESISIGLDAGSAKFEFATLKSSLNLAASGAGVTSSNTVAVPAAGSAPTVAAIAPTGSGVAATNTPSAIINTSSSVTNLSSTSSTYSASVNRVIETCNQGSTFIFAQACSFNSNTFTITFDPTQLASLSSPFEIELNHLPVTIPFSRYEIQQVSNITAGSSDTINSMLSYNNELYLAGSKLYKLNSAGTAITQLSNIRSGGSDGIDSLTIFNGEIYFIATLGSVSCGTSCIETVDKVYKYNPTTNVISRVSNTRNNAALGDDPSNLMAVGNFLYYKARSNVSDLTRLYRLNTSGTTVVATAIRSTAAQYSSDPDLIMYMTPFNNELYFQAATAASATALRLYRINTAGTVHQVANFNATSDSPWKFIEHNNAMYFRAISSAGVNKIFKLSTAGTMTQVSNTAGASLGDRMDYPTRAGTDLYFLAHNPSNFIKLFKLNSTDQITQITNLNPSGADNIDGQNMMYYNNELYFVATEPAKGSKLYKVKANGEVEQVSNLSGSSAAADYISSLMVFNDELYFLGTNSSGYTKIHKLGLDGKIGVMAVRGATESDYPSYLTIHNGELYFTLQNTSGQTKLFKIKKI